MNKQILGLSLAGAIALAGATPISAEDCDGVLVQSRFALVNCMIESAVAIAASAAEQNGCSGGEWTIEAIVPEYYLATIPVQGLTHVYNESDRYQLNGQSSALEKNHVNCRVATTESGNTFAGQQLTYSSGFANYYPNAIINKDESMLCITESVSSGNIALGPDDFNEVDDLTFGVDDGQIVAAGLLTILEGQKGNNPHRPQQALSAWNMEAEVLMPELGETAEDGFELEAMTYDIGNGCEIEVEGSVENLRIWTVEGLSGGLTVFGTLSVKQEDEDE